MNNELTLPANLSVAQLLAFVLDWLCEALAAWKAERMGAGSEVLALPASAEAELRVRAAADGEAGARREALAGAAGGSGALRRVVAAMAGGVGGGTDRGEDAEDGVAVGPAILPEEAVALGALAPNAVGADGGPAVAILR